MKAPSAMPHVSIGVPFTDQGEELAQAIRSILDQTHKAFELILYGDGPSSQAKAIAHEFDDNRIRLYESPERKGLAATLNEIARLARYPLLARMDADDIMHPQRIARQKTAFDADPELDVLGSHAYLMDSESNLVGAFNEPDLPHTGEGFLRSNAFSHPTVMARTAWFLKNPYDEQLLRGQDKELWLRTWSESRFRKLDDRLMFYRAPREVVAAQLRRNEAYNRKIMKSYAHLERSAFSKSGRLLASHAKEVLLGLAGVPNMSRFLYDRKWTALEAAEMEDASRVLECVVRSRVVAEFQEKIVAVTVTYGRRDSLVKRTALAALRSGASQVIIIDNGSTAAARSAMQRLGDSDHRVKIVTLPTNAGSAPGFARGISEFLDSDGTHVWLLDDDNECEEPCLRHLLESLKAEERKRPGSVAGAFAVREGNSRQRAVAAGTPIGLAYPQPGSFMYFDIVQFVKSRILGVPRKEAFGGDISGLPYGPYGGLLMGRASIMRIGLPDVNLGLYEDDTEFTSRVVNLGGTLVLSASAKIHDIDPKWSQTNGAKGLAGLVLAGDPGRTYFAVRNRANFDKSRVKSGIQHARFTINRLIFSACTVILAVRFRKCDQAGLILDAIRDGLKSNLSRRFTQSDQTSP